MNIAPAGMSRKQPTRRGRTWRFAAIVGLVLTIPVEIYLGLWLEASWRVERERCRVSEGLARLRAEQVLRPNFFDPEVEGNSWELIRPALRSWKSSPTTAERVYFFTDKGDRPRGKPEDLDRILDMVQPRIQDLKEALRRRLAEPDHDYGAHIRDGVPDVMQAWSVFTVLSGAATHRQFQGRDGEALDCILICLGLADHLRVKGEGLHEAAAGSGDRLGFDALKRLLAAHDLTASELTRLSRALERLESSWPDPLQFDRWLEPLERLAILEVAKGGPSADKIRSWWPEIPRWRYLFSDRMLVRQVLENLDDYFDWSRKVGRLPIPEMMEAAEARRLAQKESQDPVSQVFFGCAWHFTDYGRTRARMELARVATALARFHADRGFYPSDLTRLVPHFIQSIPLDPLSGQPLKLVLREESAVIRANGWDGDDDQGRALQELPSGWPDLKADGDIVWTVKRRR
jgi:hypothetical protein